MKQKFICCLQQIICCSPNLRTLPAALKAIPDKSQIFAISILKTNNCQLIKRMQQFDDKTVNSFRHFDLIRKRSAVNTIQNRLVSTQTQHLLTSKPCPGQTIPEAPKLRKQLFSHSFHTLPALLSRDLPKK